jgi:outer membrane immunogenic protein
MKRLLIVGALAIAAGQAFAADLPQPPPMPPRAPAMYVPTVVPVYNWGGIYFGANGGYGFGNSKWTDPNNLSLLGTTGQFSTTGFVVGPTLGANFQTDAFVFGIEGDYDGSWIDGKVSSLYCGSLGFGGAAQCETKNTWIATLRGRVGYAVDRVLFYATAGGALGDIQAGANTGLLSSTKGGWAAGAGVEAAFSDNWTARIEYLFVDLSNASCSQSNPCGLNGAALANQSVAFSASMIRLGIDYKFR